MGTGNSGRINGKSPDEIKIGLQGVFSRAGLFLHAQTLHCVRTHRYWYVRQALGEFPGDPELIFPCAKREELLFAALQLCWSQVFVGYVLVVSGSTIQAIHFLARLSYIFGTPKFTQRFSDNRGANGRLVSCRRAGPAASASFRQWSNTFVLVEDHDFLSSCLRI